jgi:hypothetical protein
MPWIRLCFAELNSGPGLEKLASITNAVRYLRYFYNMRQANMLDNILTSLIRSRAPATFVF